MKHLKKKKGAQVRREVIQEPVRHSVYDVIQKNLKLAKRAGYIHRVIFVGEHDHIDIAEILERNYKITNSVPSSEPLSGLLLHYDAYFSCILEGSEEALNKFIQLLCQIHELNHEKVKLLKAVHHVATRFWDEWLSYYAKPPQRVEDIDPNCDLDTTMGYVFECCKKIYNFATAFVSQQLQYKGRQSTIVDDDQELPSQKKRSRSFVERDQFMVHLPEIALLEFLINSPKMKTLKVYNDFYEYIGQSKDYRLKTWPAPKNLVTYNIFDERYDPIEDLPLEQQSVKELATSSSFIDRSN